MNKRKKTQADLGKEHAMSQPTVSRVLSEHGELKRRLDLALAREREAKASLREIQLKHEAGSYVPLDAVKADAADARERVLGILRAVAQRTAMSLECACRPAAVVEAKIAEEVERAIAEIRESRFAGK